jgi:hypothetical protein
VTAVSCAPKETTKSPAPVSGKTAQDIFFDALSTHCGHGFNGKLVSADEADTDLVGQAMQMKVGPCTDSEIRVPFHIGDNHSRTWVVSRTETGLRLKHRHGHEDGTEDTVSQYGGDTTGTGLSTRQEFPADGFSIALFLKEGLDVSVDNVWAIDLTPEIYAYELNRPNRHFRVEFDLTKPVDNVPDPW